MLKFHSDDLIDTRLSYSIAEAALILGISRGFAYRLVAAGDLPTFRLGRRRLVARRDLEAFVEARTAQAVAR